MREEPIHLPQGALLEPDGEVVWRVWAPHSASVVLILDPRGERRAIPMQPQRWGYFEHRQRRVAEGTRYLYRLSDGGEYPDPASRSQPEGVHAPSAVYFPDSLDREPSEPEGGPWRGIAREDLVFYELHVGTFTPEGDFDAVVARLETLRALGVTAIELMPVAEFPGARNWGYDGVFPFAAQSSYGGPRALARLIRAAHRAGLAVFLDVVYNHLGPEGNYLAAYGPYFTDRYQTPWGKAINFDGADCDAVRQFFIDNARMWIRDFGVDGLRLDAVHAIFDLSPRHILADIQAAVQREAAAAGRIVHVIAESDQNDARLIRAVNRGGYGLDGIWSDDFHHGVHALLTGERDGYYSAFGSARELAKVYTKAFVYDGCYSPYRRRRHGSATDGCDRGRFVVCVQNHDQVGNRALGDRFGTLLPPSAQRLAAALMLVSPFLPLLFMGEEYGETRPFPFFCSFGDAALIEAVRHGRRAEFAELEFTWGSAMPDPQAEETFRAATLAWEWPEGSRHSGLRRLYGELLALRRLLPGLRDRASTRATVLWGKADSGSAAEDTLLVLYRGSGSTRVAAAANLTPIAQPMPAVSLRRRKTILSTEDSRFDGARTAESPEDALLPHELMLFGSEAGR